MYKERVFHQTDFGKASLFLLFWLILCNVGLLMCYDSFSVKLISDNEGEPSIVLVQLIIMIKCA